MKSFKNLARAISPFVSSGSMKAKQQATSTDYDQFDWDLSQVNMADMLVNFYKVYNPERVGNVLEILSQYEGEEVLMLQKLCERYSLSQADIQRFLIDAPKGKTDRFNRANKRSESTGKSFDNSSVSSVPDFSHFHWDLSAVDLAQALKLLYKKHNPHKTPNVASLDDKSYSDRITLLQQLCKRHNLKEQDMQVFLDKAPMKSAPSVASSAPPSVAGSIQYSRNGAAADGSSGNSYGGDSAPGGKSSDGGGLAASMLQAQAQDDDGSASGSARLKRQANLRAASVAKPSAYDNDADEAGSPDDGGRRNIITGKALNPPPQPSGPQKSSSMSLWPSIFSSSSVTAASASPPPPPPPALSSTSPQGVRPPPPPAAAAFSSNRSGSLALSARQAAAAEAYANRRPSPGSVADSVNSSVTGATMSSVRSRTRAGGSTQTHTQTRTQLYGASNTPVGSAAATATAVGRKNNDNNNKREPSVDVSRGVVDVDEVVDLDFRSNQTPAAAAAAANAPVVAGKPPPPPPPPAQLPAQRAQSVGPSGGASVSSFGGAAVAGRDRDTSAALEAMQRELAEAQAQIAGVQKENRTLLNALQESKLQSSSGSRRGTHASGNESVGGAGQGGGSSVADLLLDISNLKLTLQQQEGNVILFI
jgi:hypothetical protein